MIRKRRWLFLSTDAHPTLFCFPWRRKVPSSIFFYLSLSVKVQKFKFWFHLSVVGTQRASSAAMETQLFSSHCHKRILWNTWAWVIPPPPHTGPKILRVRLLGYLASCVTQVNRRTKFWERGAYVCLVCEPTSVCLVELSTVEHKQSFILARALLCFVYFRSNLWLEDGNRDMPLLF